MTLATAVRLVEAAGTLRHLCDVDLLIFFARHPHAMLPSESLAAFLGRDPKQVADSLEVLMNLGCVDRKQTRSHTARLYVFAPDRAHAAWLPDLIELASTRTGRLALRNALRHGSASKPALVRSTTEESGGESPTPSADGARGRRTGQWPRQRLGGSDE